MKKEKLINYLQEKQDPGNWLHIANQFDVTGTSKQKSDYVRRLWKSVKQKPIIETKALFQDSEEWREFQEFKAKKRSFTLKPYLGGNPKNVLAIGDIHEPFCKDGYLEFCRFQQERFDCGKVIFLGDILDHHAQSFHDTDADGLSAKDELNLAILKLAKWYQVFPNADVCLGNHDRIVARKLFAVGLSQRWLKPLGEVLQTPTWSFKEEIIYNNIMYIHGEGGTAFKKAQQEMISVVQGHLHSEAYVQFLNGGKSFGMQVGCGIDFSTYAFAYAQRGKKPVLSCGVVLDHSPILIPFQ